MNDLKSILTRDHGTINCRIDTELQKNNSLAERGIFLVEVENGVAWGYDEQFYEYQEDNSIARKQANDFY